jgi:hypothetical protein
MIQDIKAELTNDIRAFKAPDLAQYIVTHKLLSQLITCCLDKDQLLSSRSMWVLGHVSDLDNDVVIPYYDKLILNLKNKELHNGVIRNTLRLFQKFEVPKKHETFLLDKCYEYITNPQEAIAVRSFAMTVVFNISKPYAELLNELKLVLTEIKKQDEGPGIKSKVTNTLKQIDKLNAQRS